MQARTAEHVAHLYGDRIVGEVVMVKRTPVEGGERTQLTLDVRSRSARLP